MGSHLLFGMPRTGRYTRVIALLGDSAGGGGTPGVAAGTLEQIADATLDASLAGLELARNDEGLAYCVYLMVQVTRAACEPGFLLQLHNSGVPTPAIISGLPDVPVITDPAEYSIYDLISGFTAAVDRHLRVTRARGDVSELAQLGAAESLSVLCSQTAQTLYGSTPQTAQASLKELSTQGGFAGLAHDFFARFTSRFLEYHLSRELSNHVGPQRRFRTVDEHNDFLVQLQAHCHVATRIMRDFAGQWYTKHIRQRDMSLKTAKGFVAHAIDKVREALAYQEGRDV